jgi:predicted PurR-regulated permease PerM
MELRVPKLFSRAPESGEQPSGLDADPGPPGQPRPVPKVVVPRWVQLVLLPIALLALWALARASGSVLLILVIASVVALILNPVVKLLERCRVPRPLAILLVYVGGFAALGGVGVLLSNPISSQITRFQHDVPSIVRKANKDLASLQKWLDRNGINIHVQKQGQTALQTLQKNIVKRSGDIVSFSRDLLQKLVVISFSLVLVLVLSVYLLIYGKDIGRLVRRIMPPGDGTPEDDYPLLVQRAVAGYVRGQLLFSILMGAGAAVSLWIFGALGIFPDGSRYALFFGGFYGLMELVPYVGPFIGALPAVVVALFSSPATGLWVALLFVALQQIEGHIVAPQVFGKSLRINPILIILSLLIGGQLYGIAGALVALPIAAVVRETVLYLSRHLVLEPWGALAPGTAAPGAVGAGSGAGPSGPGPAGGAAVPASAGHTESTDEATVSSLDAPATAAPDEDQFVARPLTQPDRCSECGALPGPDDTRCPACGASLEPQVRTRR